MRITRAGAGVLWVGMFAAFVACSGKTKESSDDGPEAPEGGVESAEPTPATTGGRAATGGSATTGGAGATTGGASATTGGASAGLFGCGPVSCVEGKSYCYNFTSGTPGQPARAECKRLLEDCGDCACLCPPSSPDGQCSASGDDASASCLCGGEPGKIVISCFGA